MQKSYASYFLLFGGTLVFVGCDWLGGTKKEERQATTTEHTRTTPAKTGKPMLYKDGDVIATVEDYERFRSQAVKIQPQVEQLLKMPGMEKKLLWENFKVQTICDWDIKRNKIDQQKSFQDELDSILYLSKLGLSTNYFIEKHNPTVSDSEVQSYYDTHKEEFIQKPAMVDGSVIFFDTEADANAFLDKAKAPGAKFDDLAKSMNKEVKELKQISRMSFDLDSAVRDALLEMKSVPGVTKVSTDEDTFAVVKADKRTTEEYAPLDTNLKNNLKSWLKEQKKPQILMDEIKKIEQQEGIKEDLSYFGPDETDMAKQMEQQKSKKTVEEKKKADEAAKKKLPESSSVKSA